MSAFLCDSYHIVRMAAHIAASQESSPDVAAWMGAAMGTANVASIQSRYPDTVERFEDAPGLVTDCADGVTGYIAKCAEAARVEWADDHDPNAMYGAASCYSYQCCEYAGWKRSDGFALYVLALSLAVADGGRERAGCWELEPLDSPVPARLTS